MFFINFQGPIYVCGKVQVLKTTPDEPTHQAATTGIENQEGSTEYISNEYRVYPNPASEGFFYIDYTGSMEVYGLEIYSLDGRKVFSIAPNANEQITIQTGNFQPGLYIIQINSSAGITNEKVLVK